MSESKIRIAPICPGMFGVIEGQFGHRLTIFLQENNACFETLRKGKCGKLCIDNPAKRASIVTDKAEVIYKRK